MITQNKIISLADLVAIRSGVYRKIVPVGDVHLIQKGSFGTDGKMMLFSDSPDLKMESGFQQHLLTGDEILLTAKGESNVAYTLPRLTVPAVASSVFLILTIISPEISGTYLAWYLNTRAGQRNLSQLSRGSGMPSLAKRDLQQMAISVPPLPIQEKILKLAALRDRESELYQQLILAKQKLAEAQLLQLAGHKIHL